VVIEFRQKAASQGRIFHSGKNLTWHRPDGSLLCQFGVLNDPFAAKTAAETASVFKWAGRPSNILPLPLGDLHPHPIHGSLGVPDSVLQTVSRSAQPFLQGTRTWPIDRQTYRQIVKPRYSVCSNRPLSLAIAGMWPKAVLQHVGAPKLVQTRFSCCCISRRWVKKSRQSVTLNVYTAYTLYWIWIMASTNANMQ